MVKYEKESVIYYINPLGIRQDLNPEQSVVNEEKALHSDLVSYVGVTKLFRQIEMNEILTVRIRIKMLRGKRYVVRVGKKPLNMI